MSKLSKNRQENCLIGSHLGLMEYKVFGELRIKNLTSLHLALAAMFNECLTSEVVPDWLTKGTTYLIIKDKSKGNDVTNYRPITCLSLLWKLFTGILAEEMS